MSSKNGETRAGAGQSDPLFEPGRLLMATPTPSTEVPAQENLLQKYKERVERLSQQDRLIKICTDAGFLKTVEVGQLVTDLVDKECDDNEQETSDTKPREEDGALEFWRLIDNLRNDFENSQHWSDEMWKSKMQGGGGNKKRFQCCTDSSGQEILYLRALQGHSGRNPIDPSLQDNCVNSGSISSSTFITLDVRPVYTPSQIQDRYRKTKFEQGKTDSILYGCESHGHGIQRSVQV